jgi:hypothetical protein
MKHDSRDLRLRMEMLRVRAALDATADCGGKGWCVCVTAAGRPLGALVSTRITNYAHLSVAGLTFLAWRP